MFTHEPTMPGIRPGPALLVMVLLAGCGGAGSTQEGAAAPPHSPTLQPVERPVARPMDRGANQPGIRPVERPVAKPLDRPTGELAGPDRS